MKDNTLAKIFAISAAGAIAVSAALAQTTTTVTTNAGPVTTAELTTRTGSFVTYTPGDEYFTFRTTPAAEPVRYYYTKETTFVDPTGRTVELSEIRPDLPATVYYVNEGNRMIVRKVVLSRPSAVIEKKETTTTTTTTP
ncbi:MAG: hypothetical protein DME42_07975 [Verrucomicrobia bacterium]|nr:MAG: hypothetical protein DME42_07975 [Verrucomicrobiota bacterium]